MVGRTLIRTAFAAISASRMVCRQNSRLANLAFLFHPLGDARTTTSPKRAQRDQKLVSFLDGEDEASDTCFGCDALHAMLARYVDNDAKKNTIDGLLS
jgi:hypothetical protein